MTTLVTMYVDKRCLFEVDLDSQCDEILEIRFIKGCEVLLVWDDVELINKHLYELTGLHRENIDDKLKSMRRDAMEHDYD